MTDERYAFVEDVKNHNISYCHRGKGYRMSEEKIKAWGEWLGKDDESEQKTEEQSLISSKEVPMDSPDDETKTIEETDESESYVIPSMQVHLRIDNQDQIIEMLSKLPKAKKGQIMFVWGKED